MTINILEQDIIVTIIDDDRIVVNLLNNNPNQQAAIQFLDEGNNLGTQGTVTAINFVGSSIVATRSGSTITVTATGGGGGSGDVVGPASSTDNAITRFLGVTGKAVDQATAPIIHNDEGSLTFPQISGAAYQRGKLLYDTDNECPTFFNSEADISLQIGQENWVRVRNDTGSTILNGKAVYVSGSSGGLPQISLADADVEATALCIGLATHDIETNTIGYVTTGGAVRGLDTSAFSVGDKLWLSGTAGTLTKTKPSPPVFRVSVATVLTVNATTGMLFVRTGSPGIPSYVTLTGVVTNAGGAPADATTYYFGNDIVTPINTVPDNRRVYIPVTGTIVYARVTFFNTGTLGTAETSTISLRLNNTTDTAISALVTNNALYTNFVNTALTIAVVDGDYFELKWTTPTWVTNPTGVSPRWEILIQV